MREASGEVDHVRVKLLHELDWPRRTDRLELRPARVGDAGDVWRWHRQPEVTRWMPRNTPDAAAFAASFELRLGMTVLGLLDGQVVASTKLQLTDAWAQDEVAEQAGQFCELGWVLDPAVQSQGLGTELAAELLAIAFDGLGVRRAVAYCFADNTPSWKLMEKIGMRREAHFRSESLHRELGWVDGFAYALLAQEWRARRAAPAE